ALRKSRFFPKGCRNPRYIIARYPDYKKSVDVPTKDAAENIYRKTQEIYKWLMEKLELQR
ncbi:MAG: HEPN domain-containing protein, partial [bacterium]|nr:HEPN domain-containing protein [bacterium]